MKTFFIGQDFQTFIMRTILYFLIIMCFAVTNIKAQIGTGFEEPFGGSFDYIDPDFITIHLLDNHATPYGSVTHTYSGGELGFTSTFTPTRTGTSGSTGLADGDALGVLANSYLVSSTDVPSWATGQGYVIEDPDGMLTIEFDIINLAGTSNPHFQMDLWVDFTSYEAGSGSNDRIFIGLDIDNGSSIVTVLDSDGGGAGGGGGGDLDSYIYPASSSLIEAVMTNIDFDLTAYVGSTVKLFIEADFDSGSEKVILDNISFTEGAIGGLPMPLEVTDLSGRHVNGENLVEWTLEADLENQYVLLERSADGVVFEQLAQVKDSATNAKSYQYKDERPLEGDNYYRLIQVDNHDSRSASHIIVVDAPINDQSAILYPNPSRERLNVKTAKMESYAYQIYNSTGMILKSGNFSDMQYNHELNVQDLATGIYVLSLYSNNARTEYHTFIKD